MPTAVEEKVEYIRAINPQYVFEDQVEIIEQAEVYTGSKSKVICVNNPYNKSGCFGNKVLRIEDYKDEQLKTELKTMCYINAKGCSESAKSSSKLFYRIMKVIGTPFAYAIYKPIIYGNKLIPKDKNVAFVGNHRKKSDPIIMTAIAKQVIHWAALERMFVGGETLFSDSKKRWKCNWSAKFIKWMGAVPIARQDSPEYAKINLDTIRFLTNQLKGKRASVGFFPEGTLNRDFMNQDILPLKSNRIFKVVSISGSYIQPFSIVWVPDNKLIRNKVIVLFSYPINSENRSVDELSEMWKSAEERGIRVAKEFIDSLIQIEEGDLNRREKRKFVKEKMRELKN